MRTRGLHPLQAARGGVHQHGALARRRGQRHRRLAHRRRLRQHLQHGSAPWSQPDIRGGRCHMVTSHPVTSMFLADWACGDGSTLQSRSIDNDSKRISADVSLLSGNAPGGDWGGR